MRKVSEAADDYPHIVAMLNDGRRVIECAARIQLIIQARLRETRHPWESQSFCRTKEALLRLAGPHPTLTALLDRFPEGGETAPGLVRTTSRWVG